jgi:superfamily II DNA helicase RecQ
MNVDTECQIPDKILNGEYKILFCHPEAILSKEGRQLMKYDEYQKRVAAWVIDLDLDWIGFIKIITSQLYS